MSVSIRENPNLGLAVSAESPNGVTQRWSSDERRPANVPSGISFSTTVPGGFDSLSLTLPRKPKVSYADLVPLTTLTVQGAGGQTAWQGRLESSPRVSGDQMAVAPGAKGWQAHLADDNSARMIYVDRDFSSWRDPSAQRKINLVGLGYGLPEGGSVEADVTTGAPALTTRFADPWSATSMPVSEPLYDARGLSIASIYYAWKRESANVNPASADFHWSVYLATGDTLTTNDSAGELRASGPGSGTLTATASNRVFAALEFHYDSAVATTNNSYAVLWTCLAVYGNHGLTKRGTASATAAQGFYASDVIAHAVGTWAPLLDFSTGVNGSITPTSFVIPQLAFTEPSTVGDIISAANRYHLRDWAVWESANPAGRPTFYYYDRGARGKTWRARVGASGLEEAGPQIESIYNGVIVRYQDVDGTAKTVGPTGSGSDTTTTDVEDSDPLNPATQAGIKRWAVLDMGGVSTPAGATEVGRRFMVEAAQFNSSGRAQITGHVQDDRGVTYPAYRIRAGDTISFIDASDTSERRIVRTQYDDSSKTNSIDLDSPPEGLGALLERLQVSLVGVL